jgi:QWRF family
MDGCKTGPPKSKLDLTQKRNASSPIRKPERKEVTSNKLETPSTPRTPRRYPSPNATRNPTTTIFSLPKRAQSAERRPSTSSLPKRAQSAERRPSTPSSSVTTSCSTTPACDASAETSGPVRRGPSERIWPTKRRNLSPSFQLESVPVSKKDKASTPMPSPDKPERKRTPLGQSENMHVSDNPISKMMEKQRWPGMAGGKTASINLTRSVDLTDKIARPGPASSLLHSRGTSPKRSPVSDVSNSMTRSIENGAVSKLLAQLGPNATSRSVDLLDRPKKSISRGNSPRRTLSTNNTDIKDKDKRPESRGSSPARTISSASIGAGARSKGVDVTDKTKRPVSSTSSFVQSRGPSPLRIPASEVTASGSTKNPESRGSRPESQSNRPVSRGSSSRRTSVSEVSTSALSSSIDLGEKRIRSTRGASPGRHSVSEFPARDMSRSMDLNRSKRPASSSGQRKSVSNRNSESDEKMGLGPNTPPQRSERSHSLTRGSRTLSSPVPGFGRPSSPSTKRFIQNPSRGRPSTPNSTSSSSSGGSTRGTVSCASLVNSVSQTRKVKNKASGNQVEELHQLRLLHSRHLQWQFVNACVEDMHLNQKMSSEVPKTTNKIENWVFFLWKFIYILHGKAAIFYGFHMKP